MYGLSEWMDVLSDNGEAGSHLTAARAMSYVLESWRFLPFGPSHDTFRNIIRAMTRTGSRYPIQMLTQALHVNADPRVRGACVGP